MSDRRLDFVSVDYSRDWGGWLEVKLGEWDIACSGKLAVKILELVY